MNPSPSPAPRCHGAISRGVSSLNPLCDTGAQREAQCHDLREGALILVCLLGSP